MKKALITGITGMVGSHLVDYLLENTKWEILGIVRWRSPLDNIEHLIDGLGLEDIVIDGDFLIVFVDFGNVTRIQCP